jgi:hypothetical protein
MTDQQLLKKRKFVEPQEENKRKEKGSIDINKKDSDDKNDNLKNVKFFIKDQSVYSQNKNIHSMQLTIDSKQVGISILWSDNIIKINPEHIISITGINQKDSLKIKKLMGYNMWSNEYLSVDSIFNVLKKKDIDVTPASIQKMKKLLMYESMIRDALIEFVKQFDIKQNEFKLKHAQARVREMLKHVQQVINKSDIKADIEFITKDDHSSEKNMLNRIVEDVNWLNNQWGYTTANNITAVVSINKN